jgi:GT2 family glycosyltransferase
MNNDQPAVAVIIVAYGHAAQLGATLAALTRLQDCSISTIVVENGDGASAAVARNFPNVLVLEPGRNAGFAGGCNLAVAHTNASPLVLVNPDLEPEPNFVHALTAPLRDEQVGIVGAKLRYPDGKIQHAGGYVTEPSMLAQHYGYGEEDHGQWDTARDVPFVTGAALAMRRATWDALGGLDEAFAPAYYEDADICWRAREHGLRVLYEPQAVAVHHEAAALGKGSAAYHRLYHRNRLRFVFKHHNDGWLLRHWLPAELAHLRATADDAEIDALVEAFVFWQSTFLAMNQKNGDALFQPSAFSLQPFEGELAWTVDQVAKKRTVAPQPFRSRWPLVARLRTWLNRLVTEEYVRPLVQQQNDYNAALHQAINALARQRRTTDAAVLCQAMLLAKFLHPLHHHR